MTKDSLAESASDKYAYLSFDFTDSLPHYAELSSKVEALHAIKRITTDTVFVKDLYSDRFIHLDDQLLNYAGYDTQTDLLENDELFDLIFDQESRAYIMSFEKSFVDFLHQFDVDRRSHIVGTAKYSIIHKKGHRIPFSLQITPFLSDNSQKIWALLGCISYSVKNFEPQSFIQLIDTGELFSICLKTNSVEPFKNFHLTNSEKQVLILCVRGYMEKDIAQEMDLAHNTVKSHKQNILRKLEVNNIQEAFFKAQNFNVI